MSGVSAVSGMTAKSGVSAEGPGDSPRRSTSGCARRLMPEAKHIWSPVGQENRHDRFWWTGHSDFTLFAGLSAPETQIFARNSETVSQLFQLFADTEKLVTFWV